MRLIVLATCFLFTLSLGGCAGENARSKGMVKILRSYEHAIRWGKMENLNSFRKEQVEFSAEHFEKMKHIQVTSYRVLSKTLTTEGLKQLVEIRYYNDEYAIERSMTDPQTWEYDDESEDWYLTSTIPNFK